MVEAQTHFRTDAILGGRLLLQQATRGHRAGTDAVLLIAATPRGDEFLIDAGAGAGAAGLGVGLRDPLRQILLIEKDAETATLAGANIALNQLEGRASVLTVDILSAATRREAGLANNSADVLISNPPFYDPATVRPSPHARKALAHVTLGGRGVVTPWLRAFSALLKPGGRMVMIHRAEALGEIIAACEGRFGDLAIRPVHPRSDAPALRVLVCGIKGSRAPLRLLPGLVLHDADGRFTPQTEAIHRGEAEIGWT